MRLINTSTLALEEFINKVPKYAILSHTWGDGEVTFAEMMWEHSQDAIVGFAATSKPANLREKAGYQKITSFCDVAKKDGFEWAWVDTCCIDKTSSAELSEAINSMYAWYAAAAVCYVYLVDVEPLPSEWHLDPDPAATASFLASRWFLRGWTLQELLAPRYLEFFAQDWSRIGSNLGLETLVSAKTGIRIGVLQKEVSISRCSAAERMSWAAPRQTTREEDTAYSLMGIFNVHMPLLYGEGKRAFARLQEEIWRQHADHTLLIWRWHHGDIHPIYTGVFADRPSNFDLRGFPVKYLTNGIEYPLYSGRGNASVVDSLADVKHKYPALQKSSPNWPLENELSFQAGEPPMMTPRGLLITLLAVEGSVERAAVRNTGRILAWTSCILGEWAVCLWLSSKCLTHLPPTTMPFEVSRISTCEVTLVKAEHLINFKPRRMFLDKAMPFIARRPTTPLKPKHDIKIFVQFDDIPGLTLVNYYPSTLFLRNTTQRPDAVPFLDEPDEYAAVLLFSMRAAENQSVFVVAIGRRPPSGVSEMVRAVFSRGIGEVSADFGLRGVMFKQTELSLWWSGAPTTSLGLTCGWAANVTLRHSFSEIYINLVMTQ